MPHGDAGNHVVGAGGKVIGKGAGCGAWPRVDEMQESRHIDYGDHLGAFAGDVDARLVRRNRYAEGPRCIALQLIERYFDGLAHIRAEERERIDEVAAVFEMRQRHEILGVIFGDDADAAVRREGEMKYSGDSM